MSDPSVSEIPRNVGAGDQIVPEDETYATPEGEEVYRVDEDKGIPVHETGVVQVQPVPGRVTYFRTFNVGTGAGTGQRILDEDPRRATATIIPLDVDIRLAGDKSSAESTGGTLLPMGVPLVLNTSDEIWASGANATANISVFAELWAR